MNNLVFQFFSIIFIKMWVFHYKHMGTMCKMSNYIHKMLLNTRGTASIVFLVLSHDYRPAGDGVVFLRNTPISHLAACLVAILSLSRSPRSGEGAQRVATTKTAARRLIYSRTCFFLLSFSLLSFRLEFYREYREFGHSMERRASRPFLCLCGGPSPALYFISC